MPDERDKLSLLGPDFQRAGTQSGDIEKIVNQPGQSVDMDGNRFQSFDLNLVTTFTGKLTRHKLHKSPDRRQWRSQLVRDD